MTESEITKRNKLEGDDRECILTWNGKNYGPITVREAKELRSWTNWLDALEIKYKEYYANMEAQS